jgi:aminopeptidase N
LSAAGELIEPIKIADARDTVIQRVAQHHRAAILSRHNAERAILAASPFATNAASTARRALANTLLCLANAVTDDEAQQIALSVWSRADNLTDLTAAMAALRDQPGAARDSIYTAFHDQWQDDLSMLNRWFQFEAATERTNASAHATALLAHPKFDGKNPNRVRAIVQFFGDQNWRGFHAADGSGYAFIASQILRFDVQNPSLAARFCEVFSRWHKCAEPQHSLQRKQLERIVDEQSISPNVREILEKTLKAGVAAS